LDVRLVFRIKTRQAKFDHLTVLCDYLKLILNHLVDAKFFVERVFADDAQTFVRPVGILALDVDALVGDNFHTNFILSTVSLDLEGLVWLIEFPVFGQLRAL